MKPSKINGRNSFRNGAKQGGGGKYSIEMQSLESLPFPALVSSGLRHFDHTSGSKFRLGKLSISPLPPLVLENEI